MAGLDLNGPVSAQQSANDRAFAELDFVAVVGEWPGGFHLSLGGSNEIVFGGFFTDESFFGLMRSPRFVSDAPHGESHVFDSAPVEFQRRGDRNQRKCITRPITDL